MNAMTRWRQGRGCPIPDGMSEATYRRVLAAHEAYQASLGDADIDDLPAFGSDVGEPMTNEEIDAECTREVAESAARKGR